MEDDDDLLPLGMTDDRTPEQLSKQERDAFLRRNAALEELVRQAQEDGDYDR